MSDQTSTEQQYFAAGAAGDIAAMEFLLREQPHLLATRDPNGLSAVLHACYNGKREAALWLVERGAPLDIHEAAAVGDGDRVGEALTGNGDDLNRYSSDGWTPLHLAAFFNHPDVVAVLADRGADLHLPSKSPFARGNTPLHAAIAHGSLGAAAVLIAHGADVNARQLEGGLTPLHIAAYQAGPDAARALLAAGADAGVKDDNGRTPAVLAEELGNRDTHAALEAAASGK